MPTETPRGPSQLTGSDMFETRIADVATAVSARLDAALEPMAGPIGAAMRHATDGGKRLRAFLVVEGAGLHGVDPAPALDAAAAIEAARPSQNDPVAAATPAQAKAPTM